MSDTTTANALEGIKLNAYNVTNGKKTVRVWYWVSERRDGKVAVICDKGYGHDLRELFRDEYHNGSDSMTDYFEKGEAVFPEGHPMFEKVVARHRANQKMQDERRARKDAKRNAKYNAGVHPGT